MEANNYNKVKRVLLVLLFANIFVATAKIIFGNIVKSASLTADGFHSLSDGTSNIIGMIGITLASKPVDKEHPYGHKKFEIMTGLIISGLLFFLGGKIIYDSVLRFMSPVTPDISIESIIVLISTVIINIIICTYEYKQGKKLNSYFLISDSVHTKSDIYTSIGVLITIVSVRLGLPHIIDTLVSVVIAILILKAGYEIFVSASNILTDRAAVDEEKIREITLSFESVKNVHKIRNRGTENDVHIDMHIMIDPKMSVEESHSLIHSIEDKIRKELNQNVQVIIHIEPFYFTEEES